MTVSTVPALAEAQGAWAVDPSHTTVQFAVKHMVITTVRGHFGQVSGVLELRGADLSASTVTVEIDAASVDTRDPRRDGHLRSADFLDAENYPTLTFRSTRVQPKGDGRFAVAGDLTIRGATRPVVLDAELTGLGRDPWGSQRIGFEATTTIDRKEFGLTWNQALEAGGALVGDQVKISLDVQAIKQGE